MVIFQKYLIKKLLTLQFAKNLTLQAPKEISYNLFPMEFCGDLAKKWWWMW